MSRPAMARRATRRSCATSTTTASRPSTARPAGAAAAGFTLHRAGAERAIFAGRAAGGLLSLVPGSATEHLHLAFPGDAGAVRRFYASAVEAGHRPNGEPGERARYHAGYFAAYVLDPDGNNIEVVDHQEVTPA